MPTSNQKILISIPRKLLGAIDIAKNEKQVSRASFIRESLIRNLHYYNKHERGPVCFPLEDVELTAPSDNLDIFNTWGPHVRRKSLILLDRAASYAKM